MWLFGGSPDSQGCFGDLWRFNVVTRVWSEPRTFGDAPPACQWCTCELWKGPLVVLFGGHNVDGSPARTFHLFNCETLTWTNLMTNCPEPKVALKEEKSAQSTFVDEEEDQGPPTWNSLLCSSPASAIFGDKLILWGGWDGAEHRTDMWCVDLNTLEWNRIRPKTNFSSSVPSAKCSVSCVIDSSSCLYLFGGWNGWQQTNDLHAVSFAIPSLQDICLEFLRNNKKIFEGDERAKQFVGEFDDKEEMIPETNNELDFM